jgi:hypothetical protein
MHLGRPWLLLASLIRVVFLTNSSTESGREHYLCSTTCTENPCGSDLCVGG